MTNSLSTLQSAMLQGPLAWIGIVRMQSALHDGLIEIEHFKLKVDNF